MDIKAASGVSNGYVRLATGTEGSGTMRIEWNAGVSDNITRYYKAVATETVYVTCQVYSGSNGNYVEYDNVSFTEVVPACAKRARNLSLGPYAKGTFITSVLYPLTRLISILLNKVPKPITVLRNISLYVYVPNIN